MNINITPAIIEQDALSVEPAALSIKTAVAMSSFSRTRLYLAIKAGKLRSHRIGGRRVILPDDLRAWIRAEIAAAAAPAAAAPGISVPAAA